MRRVLLLGAVLVALTTSASAQLSLPRAVPSPQATFPPQGALGMATRPGGTYTLTTVNLPVGASGVLMFLDLSEQNNPIPLLSAELEGSRDGGVNWEKAGSFERPASNKTVVNGVTIQTTGVTLNGGPFWTDTNNSNRKLRGSATIGGTLRFSLTVQLL